MERTISPTPHHYMKTATIGSISSGTLKSEDLLSAFISELEWQVSRNGDYFSKPENFSERDRLANLIGEAQDAWSDDGETLSEDGEQFIEEISDVLGEFAPPYCYFGAHYGDGADFGFWPSFDSIEELPTVEDSDGAIALGEDCKAVNDHGNVTVYGADGSVLLELV